MLNVAVGFYKLRVGVERRIDNQLVAVKHAESISELEFIQRLMINCKKIHGLFWFFFFFDIYL